MSLYQVPRYVKSDLDISMTRPAQHRPLRFVSRFRFDYERYGRWWRDQSNGRGKGGRWVCPDKKVLAAERVDV